MTAPSSSFWRGRRVLLTGHTGFKGGWLACWLNQLKAEVHGFSLAPEKEPHLYGSLQLPYASEKIGDLRDPNHISEFIKLVNPEIVFHLAAQPLVRPSYRDPVKTFSTNVMGTVHLLQALRTTDSLKAILVVTSDKAYENTPLDKSARAKLFRESDPLGGFDPYSASKAAQEFVTHSFAQSYFHGKNIPVATARAGNVIGGGDWSEYRLMTDVIQAAAASVPVQLRFPDATRPWQHVLEPLAGYLSYVEALVAGELTDRTLNFGPSRSHRVIEVVETVLALWPNNAGWVEKRSTEPEAQVLELDSARAMSALGWKPHLTLEETVRMVVEWYQEHSNGGNALAATSAQIARYQDVLRTS